MKLKIGDVIYINPGNFGDVEGFYVINEGWYNNKYINTEFFKETIKILENSVINGPYIDFLSKYSERFNKKELDLLSKYVIINNEFTRFLSTLKGE